MGSLRAWALAAVLAGLSGCAGFEDVVWTRSERLSLAAGRDFARCAASAVAGVPGLSSREDGAMKQYFDAYLVLGGPPVDALHGMVGDLSLRGATIQVEFTSRPRKLPDAPTREATERLVTELRARVESQCS